MTATGSEPGHIQWHRLSLTEAWKLRDRWDETADARLTWLEAQAGIPLQDNSDSVARLWEWFLASAANPSGLDTAPPPVWWAGPPIKAPAYHRQIGLEALCTHVEQICWNRYPDLVPSVSIRPKGAKRATALHEPGLSFTPNPVTGAAWPTAQMLRTGMNVLAWDAPDSSRLLGWYPRWYGDIALWVDTKRATHEKSGDPVVVIERIPDEESDHLGGFRWDISFDEQFAHEREDLVAAYATALEDIDGVEEVEHYDRGMIRVAGDVGVRTLRSWSKKWLASYNS